MNKGDVLATLSSYGEFAWPCWCGVDLAFRLGIPERRTCACGAIWAWSGDALERRPSARRARLNEAGGIVCDEHGAIVWEWAEQDVHGRWVDGR